MKESVIIFKPKKEDVYNWHGNQLLPESRDYVSLNNIVRLQFMDTQSKWWEVIYVKIVDIKNVKIAEINIEKLYGEALDTYRIMEDCQKYVKNGEIIEFERNNILEIPYDVEFWAENNNLKHLENMRTGKGRGITGLIDPDDGKDLDA